MFSPLRSLLVAVSCLLVSVSISNAQNITTWHNDINRTGWQQNETVLTQQAVGTPQKFGLLYQWQVTGAVYAQPLAVYNLQGVANCQNPCNVLFVATEEDKLYAINTADSSLTYIWGPQAQPLDLAGFLGGTSVDCTQKPAFFQSCVGMDETTGAPGPFSKGYIGVTGTPVIDMSATPHPILYVVAAVCFSSNCTSYNVASGYYLFAVDATNGTVLATTLINGTVPGQSPGKANKCTSDYPTSGNITFSTIGNPNAHLQRSALLLLNVGSTKTVYVAFADLPEYNNGWIFGYILNGNNQFQMVANFVPTPYGTGGGIWGSGAGPAADANGNIYLATANGTIFDLASLAPPPVDLGDALLKLQPTTTFPPGLTVADWWTPYDVLNYQGTNPNTGQPCTSLCECDEDLASGGVLVVPPPYQYTCTGSCTQCSTLTGGSCSVVINADKQSNVYVSNQAKLGGFQAGTSNSCPSNPTNIECIQTPQVPQDDPTQGYWASPAYWFDGMHHWLYYSATMQNTTSGVSPEAVNAYQLATSGGSAGPISQTPYATTSPTLFCDYSPTPSVSSNPNSLGSSGIVWAIERSQNADNQGSGQQDCYPGSNPIGKNLIPHGALHAFCATAGGSSYCPNVLTEIYSSRSVKTSIGNANGFVTPTVFNGQVYMGTALEVDVFGMCSNGIGGFCKP